LDSSLGIAKLKLPMNTKKHRVFAYLPNAIVLSGSEYDYILLYQKQLQIYI